MHSDSQTTVHWGILGCGGIAESFATALPLVPGARLSAVAARDSQRASDFARRHGSADQPIRSYDHYDSLIHDDTIDVIYIATTHHNHAELSQACLRSGKAVLCEKPVALNHADAAVTIAIAESCEVLFMEAMWTRFIPAFVALLEQLHAGVIGPPQLVQADFGIDHDWSATGRMLNPHLGGGSLLDLGIYPLTVASLVFGNQPDRVHGLMQAAPETRVDQLSCYLTDYGNGRMGQLMSGCRLRVSHQARIYGPLGRIVVNDFFHPHSFTIERHDADPEIIDLPYESTGYQYEAAAMQQALAAGQIQHPDRPWSETLGVMQTMDQLRQQWGLRYPGE